MMKNRAWLDEHVPYLVGKSILITGGDIGDWLSSRPRPSL